MGKICKQIIWNSNPANKDRKLIIDEEDLVEMAP